MDRSATRLTALLDASPRVPAVVAGGQLFVDLTARSSAAALASVQRQLRVLLHARDAVDEWRISTELRPPTVRAFEAAAAELLATASESLDLGWQSMCAACGQAVRVAAWRWDEALDADREIARPTARRASCAACRALGRRGGEATTMLPNESVSAAPLEPMVRARVDACFAGAVDGAAARWSIRQLRALNALSSAIERSTESAAMLGALRLTLAEAAEAMARPHRAGRTWWEIAPWQALLDAIDARRRIYLTAAPVPAQLSMSSDLSALGSPGGGSALVRGGVAARAALASLVTRTPTLQVALLRITVGGRAEERSDSALAARWAGDQSEPDPLLATLQSGDAVTIAAALARLLVAMNPLMRHDPLLVIDLDDEPEQLAGVLTAISLAGGAGSVTRRFDEEQVEGLTVTAQLKRSPMSGLQQGGQIALVADLLVAHGEPVVPQQLLPAYASARASAAHAAGELLDAARFSEELRRVADLHGTLRPAGSFDQIVAVAGGRVFVEGRAERERLASPAADRADAAVFKLVAALDAGEDGDAQLVALDADPIGTGAELRRTLLAAYTSVGDGVRRSLRSARALEEDRLTTLAALLELGPRMGLHVAVAPALSTIQVAGRTLGLRVTVDPIDDSPPLRTRSDRAAYDAVDAVLYRRGRVVLLCEVVTGPLPIAALLLQRHAQIASDREVVRLLVLAPALIPLLLLRLDRDERLSAAWDSGNWHMLATDRVGALSRLAAPRLADLEGHLGAEPSMPVAAQLDLSLIDGVAVDGERPEGVEHGPRD